MCDTRGCVFRCLFSTCMRSALHTRVPFSPLSDRLWSASAAQWCPGHWAGDWIAAPKLNHSTHFCEHMLSNHLTTDKLGNSRWSGGPRLQIAGQVKVRQVTVCCELCFKKAHAAWLFWLTARRMRFHTRCSFSHDLFHCYSVCAPKVPHISVSDSWGEEKGEKEKKGAGAVGAHLHFKRGAGEVRRACRAQHSQFDKTPR